MPGVAAAGQDDQAVAAHHRHERLVVEDQRVGLPLAIPVGLVPGKAALELRGPVDLAGHQQRAVEQEGGLALLDDLEARALAARSCSSWEARPGHGRGTRGGGGVQNSGWIRTGMFARPSRPTNPSMPVT